MTAEEDRTRLIGDIARVLKDGSVPDEARTAALTFIGWLARRMPGEPVSTAGVTVMIHRAAEEASAPEWGASPSPSCAAPRVVKPHSGRGPSGARENPSIEFAGSHAARAANGGVSSGRARSPRSVK